MWLKLIGLLFLAILLCGCISQTYQKGDIISLDNNPNSLWYISKYDSQRDVYYLVRVIEDETSGYGYKFKLTLLNQPEKMEVFGDVLKERNARYMDHLESVIITH